LGLQENTQAMQWNWLLSEPTDYVLRGDLEVVGAQLKSHAKHGARGFQNSTFLENYFWAMHGPPSGYRRIVLGLYTPQFYK
jgi:hypothetical protein